MLRSRNHTNSLHSRKRRKRRLFHERLDPRQLMAADTLAALPVEELILDAAAIESPISDASEFSVNPVISESNENTFDGKNELRLQTAPPAQGTIRFEFRTEIAQRNGYLLGHYNHATRADRIYVYQNGNDLFLRFGTRNSVGKKIASNVADGEWHSVAFTYGSSAVAGQASVFVDGVHATNVDLPPQDLRGTTEFMLGATPDGIRGKSQLNFRGSIRGFELYDQILDAPDLTNLSIVRSTSPRAADSANLTETIDVIALDRARSNDGFTYHTAIGNGTANGWDVIFSANDGAAIESDRTYRFAGERRFNTYGINAGPVEGWFERDLIRVRADEEMFLAIELTGISDTKIPSQLILDRIIARHGEAQEPGLVVGLHSGKSIDPENPVPGINQLGSAQVRFGYHRDMKINETFATIRIPKGESVISVEKYGPWFSGYQLEFKAVELQSASEIPINAGRFQVKHGDDGEATFRTESAKEVHLRVIQKSEFSKSPGRTWVITHGNMQNAAAGDTSPAIARLISAIQQRVGSNDTIVALHWGKEAGFQFPVQQASIWIKPIGQQLGRTLNQLGVDARQANYVGFSYGTHINFFAASQLNRLSGTGKAESMWALDPAAFRPKSALPGIVPSDARFYQQKDIGLSSVSRNSYAIHTDTGRALGVKSVQKTAGNKNAFTAAFGSRLISSTAHHRVELRLSEDSILNPPILGIGNRLRLHSAPLEFFVYANTVNDPGSITDQFRLGSTQPDLRGGDSLVTAQFAFSGSNAPEVSPLAIQHRGSDTRLTEAGERLTDGKTQISAFNRKLSARRLRSKSTFRAVKAAANQFGDSTGIKDFLGVYDRQDIHVRQVRGGQQILQISQDGPNADDTALLQKADVVLYSLDGELVVLRSFSGADLQRGLSIDVPGQGGYLVVRLRHGAENSRSFVADVRYEINFGSTIRNNDAGDSNESLDSKVAALRDQLAKLEQQQAITQRSNESLDIQLNGLNKEIAKQSTAHATALNRFSAAHAKVEQAKKSVAEKQSEIDSHRSRKRSSEQREKSLRSTIAEQKRAKERAWRDYKKAKGKLNKRRLYQTWKSKRDAVNDSNSKVQSENKLQSRMSRRIKTETKALNNAKSKLRTSQRKLSERKQELAKVENKLQPIHQRVEELQAQLKSQREQLAKTLEQIEAVKREIRGATTSDQTPG